MDLFTLIVIVLELKQKQQRLITKYAFLGLVFYGFLKILLYENALICETQVRSLLFM